MTDSFQFHRTILSLFDYSGRWSDPYREAGYNVIQVDLKNNGDARLWPSKSSDNPRLSFQFEDIEGYDIHGILAAPPCTVFAISGARWPRSDADMLEGLSCIDAVLRIVHAVKPRFWALENPAGKLRKWIGPAQFSFQPFWFGECIDDPDEYDRSTKRTLLWGSFNVPQLAPGKSDGRMYGFHEAGGNTERTKEIRSMTPRGFARAFFDANP